MPETQDALAARRASGALGLASVLLVACGGDLAARSPPVAVTIAPATVQVAADAPGPPQGPPGMVYVPPGPFLRGCAPADKACYAIESPPARVQLDAFYIDRVEVTVAAYRACVAAGACTDHDLTLHTASFTTQRPSSGGTNTTDFLEPAASDTCNWSWKGKERGEHPLNCVAWDQAGAYCAWAGKRLPTEAEWEKAARGTDERIYPWGDAAPTCSLAVMQEAGAPGCGAGHTAPVGSRPQGRSASGAFDLSGNVAEWVADWYEADYYGRSPAANPAGPKAGRFRVVRGGSWRVKPVDGIDALRITNRYSYVPGSHLDHVGFRCARDAR